MIALENLKPNSVDDYCHWVKLCTFEGARSKTDPKTPKELMESLIVKIVFKIGALRKKANAVIHDIADMKVRFTSTENSPHYLVPLPTSLPFIVY